MKSPSVRSDIGLREEQTVTAKTRHSGSISTNTSLSGHMWKRRSPGQLSIGSVSLLTFTEPREARMVGVSLDFPSLCMLPCDES